MSVLPVITTKLNNYFPGNILIESSPHYQNVTDIGLDCLYAQLPGLTFRIYYQNNLFFFFFGTA